MVQSFKKTIATLFKGAIHGANIDVTKLHSFPRLGQTSHRIEQYLHPHPVNSNSEEAFR
jgi:hypothetical protein